MSRCCVRLFFHMDFLISSVMEVACGEHGDNVLRLACAVRRGVLDETIEKLLKQELDSPTLLLPYSTRPSPVVNGWKCGNGTTTGNTITSAGPEVIVHGEELVALSSTTPETSSHSALDAEGVGAGESISLLHHVVTGFANKRDVSSVSDLTGTLWCFLRISMVARCDFLLFQPAYISGRFLVVASQMQVLSNYAS